MRKRRGGRGRKDRDAAELCLDPEEPAKRGGNADRPTAIGTDRVRYKARRNHG